MGSRKPAAASGTIANPPPEPAPVSGDVSPPPAEEGRPAPPTKARRARTTAAPAEPPADGGTTAAVRAARASTRKPRRRADKTAARRDAILKAALDEFSERGFAATRLDDVARRAGIAKGTIYLYFHDKEALFQELITSMLGPLIADLKALPSHDGPVRAALEHLLGLFAKEIYGTPRRHVLRLVMAEGPRFPRLAEFHYRHVAGPAMETIRTLLSRAVERGEIRHRALVDVPQLVVAPGLLAVVWASLFERHSHLDVEAMMRTHLDLLFDRDATP